MKVLPKDRTDNLYRWPPDSLEERSPIRDEALIGLSVSDSSLTLYFDACTVRFLSTSNGLVMSFGPRTVRLPEAVDSEAILEWPDGQVTPQITRDLTAGLHITRVYLTSRFEGAIGLKSFGFLVAAIQTDCGSRVYVRSVKN
jgi:hypothetical protein